MRNSSSILAVISLLSLMTIPIDVSFAVTVSPNLVITTPKDGTVVHPGQSVPVEVSVAPGVTFSLVGIIVERIGFGPYAAKHSPPYSFKVDIPEDVVGKRKITAIGMTGPGAGVFSKSVTIDVEPSSRASSPHATSISVNLDQMDFDYAGQQFPLVVTGQFSGGRNIDLTSSTQLKLTSQDTSVATVNNTGLVTAAGSGTTAIIVKYGSLSVDVPISVKSTIPGDLNGDGDVDKADLNELMTWENRPATTPSDARDLNHDGIINAQDAKILEKLCTQPGCAIY